MSARRHISNVGRPQDGLAGGLQCYPLDAVSPAYLPADIQSWAHPRIHRSSLDRRRQRLAANRVINSPMLWLLLLLLLLMVVILVDDDYAEETRASRTHTHSGRSRCCVAAGSLHVTAAGPAAESSPVAPRCQRRSCCYHDSFVKHFNIAVTLPQSRQYRCRLTQTIDVHKVQTITTFSSDVI